MELTGRIVSDGDHRSTGIALVDRQSGANRMGMSNKPMSRRAAYWRAYRAVATGESAGTIIPVKNKRLHQTSFTFDVLSQLPALFTVFAAAASAVQGDHDTAGRVIAAAGIIAGAAVLVVIAREGRHLFGRHAEHAHAAPHELPRVDAPSLAAAVLGYVEAWHRTHVVGHFKLVSPQIVGATLALVMAFVRGRPISKRRERRERRQLHVFITPTGISYLAGLRRKWRAEWSEVAAVEHNDGELVVCLHDGRRHVLRTDDHLDSGDVVAETRAAIAAHAPHVPGALSGAALSGADLSARVGALRATV